MSKVIDFGLEMKANGKRGEVRIYDVIGDSFWGDTVTAKSILKQLDEMGEIEEIDLRINSQGGQVFHAAAIYNAFKDHPAKITVHIDGIAASAASLIAMVGDTIRISENAFVMIHNPMNYAFGEAKDLRKAAQTLDQIRKSAIATYAERTGQSKAKIGEMMDEETWLSADEAVEKGFADEVSKNKSKGEKSEMQMLADLSHFRNVPEGALNLVAMFSPAERNPMSKETPEAKNESTDTPEAKSGDTKSPESPKGPLEKTPELNADDVKAQAAAEERKRGKQIRVLCEMAGCPEKADKFIDAEFSVSETQDAIAKLLEKQNAVISSDDKTPADDKQATLEAKYRQEYAERKTIHQQLGISEADYIEQRLIEDGHKEEPPLIPGSKASGK